MKKLISIFLIAAMCLSLAACGGTKEEEKIQEETPEFVYAAEYTPLNAGTDGYINPQVYTDEGMYISAYEKVGENIPEGVIPQ